MNLPPEACRRIQARCLTRVHLYRRNHPHFNPLHEFYFFLGVIEVLQCLDNAESDEWLADILAGRPIGDQTLESQIARSRERQLAADLAAFFSSDTEPA